MYRAGVLDYHSTMRLLKFLGVWFGTVAGKVITAFLVVLIIIGVFKWQSIYDTARAAWWGAKHAEVITHTANADTALVAAKKDSVTGAAATQNFEQALTAPENRNNPGAQRVGTAAKAVITAKNSEIKNLKVAVTEQKAATKAAEDAGEKPVPRIQPYADIGYAVSFTKKYGVPVVRVGATYRVWSAAHIQAELSYEPPPTISQARMDALEKINERDFAKAEIRATVTAHIAF